MARHAGRGIEIDEQGEAARLNEIHHLIGPGFEDPAGFRQRRLAAAADDRLSARDPGIGVRRSAFEATGFDFVRQHRFS
jgi:hypothetical protein